MNNDNKEQAQVLADKIAKKYGFPDLLEIQYCRNAVPAAVAAIKEMAKALQPLMSTRKIGELIGISHEMIARYQRRK